ncbi:hypothetical protein Naga_100036g25 [Nannochloropsis gaditana]|uniref:Uncharacterized protein n=1 Tax=Nannochloropsis gaditana TaxID=72520 RepID=W7TX71_9STRA|nr:hypothetical protein Naga_100036g25 [Nannochloropsis gaditana]
MNEELVPTASFASRGVAFHISLRISSASPLATRTLPPMASSSLGTSDRPGESSENFDTNTPIVNPCILSSIGLSSSPHFLGACLAWP